MGALPTPSLLTAVFLAVCLGLSSQEEGHWSYSADRDGPQHWPGACQTGKQQSPIDLGSAGVTKSDYEILSLINYDNYFNGTITNNGHTVQIKVVDNHHNIMITGGGLNGVFSLEQVHFHWESEHTIMGVRYPLEVHFVHYEKKQRKISNAIKVKGGIAVLAVVFEGIDTQEPDIQVLKEVNDIKYQETKNIKFLPKSFLPSDIAKFYRYYGSLTTPGCDESVIWTVFAEPRPISKKQIAIFEQLHDSKKERLRTNYRPLQLQNDRIIYYQSSPPKEVIWVNSAKIATESLATIMMLLIVLKYL